MKKLLTTIALAAAATAMLADNSVQSVAQVAGNVTITDDVDYHVTGDTPFADDAKVDIANTDHAVLILDAVRPSAAIKLLAKYVTIGGARAVNNTNCQVKMYDRGAIILPYGTSTKPLTVFEQPDFGGESLNTLTEGHNGSGYMKNLPTAWNNRIRSFRLKRGYMVTFALKRDGRGYSRCFIADKADIDMSSMPDIMDGRITSYRIFKWYDSSKAGIADYLDDAVLAKLVATTSFTWSAGRNMLPDVECVPHHIKENWPTASELGKADYSPHMKTNNEPINTSDDAPTDLPTILSNWEALMATGMRLCTPSSWDGSDYWNATGFLAEFLDSIDTRGWRCDIIDLHGYWNEGSFTTNVNNWAQKFQRPVWISEWVWGSSWGNAGIFGQASSRDNPTAADLQLNRTVVGRILDNLNANPAVERYFYWNSEANCSKLYRNGQLTPAGEYFAQMTTNGPGYTGYGSYVPKPWRLETPQLTATFTASTSIMKLTWTNPNGDLATTVVLERATTGGWEQLAEFDGIANEARTQYLYNDTLVAAGNYRYRVREVTYNDKNNISNIVTFTLGGTTGKAGMQTGAISAKPTETSINFFAVPFDEKPVIVTGSPTNKNLGVGMVDNILSINQVRNQYAYFQFRFNLWNSNATATARTAEEVNCLALSPGRGAIGSLAYEAAYTDNITTEAVEVRFSQPFAEAPVVMATPVFATINSPACFWRISNVTTEGFTIQLMFESKVTTKFMPRQVAWVAIEKGSGADASGNLYTVFDTELTFKSANVPVAFTTTFDEAPRVMAQLQTSNVLSASNLRIGTVTGEQVSMRLHTDKGDTANQPSSSNPVTEKVGFIIISPDPNYDAIAAPTAPTANDDVIYDLSGRRVTATPQRGLYIRGGRKHLIQR
ncbi:MAG: hypothetical protein IJS59_09080 [Bacteroidaceae bacterium]|nr:hypothetical protein [Bacteroidaceae bacterium]